MHATDRWTVTDRRTDEQTDRVLHKMRPLRLMKVAR